MYIQPPVPGREPQDFSLPKGYSGNAFRRTPQEVPPAEPPTEVGDGTVNEAEAIPSAVTEPTENAPKSLPVMGHSDSRERGLLRRLPFLSSLLPPPRKQRGQGSILPEWLLIGAVILLFFAEEEGNDILPLLLLLLLWD